MGVSICPKGDLSNLDLTCNAIDSFGDDRHTPISMVSISASSRSDGRLWVYALRGEGWAADPLIQVRFWGDGRQARHRGAVEAEVQRSLSLDIDLEPFYRWRAADSTLAQLIAAAMACARRAQPTLFGPW